MCVLEEVLRVVFCMHVVDFVAEITENWILFKHLCFCIQLCILFVWLRWTIVYIYYFVLISVEGGRWNYARYEYCTFERNVATDFAAALAFTNIQVFRDRSKDRAFEIHSWYEWCLPITLTEHYNVQPMYTINRSISSTKCMF